MSDCIRFDVGGRRYKDTIIPDTRQECPFRGGDCAIRPMLDRLITLETETKPLCTDTWVATEGMGRRICGGLIVTTKESGKKKVIEAKLTPRLERKLFGVRGTHSNRRR